MVAMREKQYLISRHAESKNKTKRTNNSNRLTDTENEIVVSRGEKREAELAKLVKSIKRSSYKNK